MLSTHLLLAAGLFVGTRLPAPGGHRKAIYMLGFFAAGIAVMFGSSAASDNRPVEWMLLLLAGLLYGLGAKISAGIDDGYLRGHDDSSEELAR